MSCCTSKAEAAAVKMKFLAVRTGFTQRGMQFTKVRVGPPEQQDLVKKVRNRKAICFALLR